MKIAYLRFAHADTKRTFQGLLRDRMYAAGYAPHQVTEMFRPWFTGKALFTYISGTADAERACDVANEVRGVMCKLSEES